MKKSFVSLLTIAAITFGMVSCNSSKKQDAAEQKVEEEAAIAGEVEHTSPESTCLRYLLRRLERIEGYEKADYRYRERIG